ncbi:MAG: hypothetical protein ACLFT3_14050 [Cyclobacteriaceae bacterium]
MLELFIYLLGSTLFIPCTARTEQSDTAEMASHPTQPNIIFIMADNLGC